MELRRNHGNCVDHGWGLSITQQCSPSAEWMKLSFFFCARYEILSYSFRLNFQQDTFYITWQFRKSSREMSMARSMIKFYKTLRCKSPGKNMFANLEEVNRDVFKAVDGLYSALKMWAENIYLIDGNCSRTWNIEHLNWKLSIPFFFSVKPAIEELWTSSKTDRWHKLFQSVTITKCRFAITLGGGPKHCSKEEWFLFRHHQFT